jgi:hypothetical protein
LKILIFRNEWPVNEEQNNNITLPRFHKEKLTRFPAIHDRPQAETVNDNLFLDTMSPDHEPK